MNARDYYLGYRSYLRNPNDFNEDQINQLFNFAQKNNLPFEYQDTDASLGSMVGQLFNGFVQGFTTLPVGEKPTNDIDGIAHSIGHLVGFASILTPGGLMTKAGIGTATKIGGKTVAQRFSRSVPMQVADFATEKAAKSTLGKQAIGAVEAVAGRQAGFAKQLMRHGAHLGVASQVSNVWEDMKEEDLPGFMANSFWTGLSGAAFGATFAGIGNVTLPQAISKLNIKGVTGRDILKGAAGSIVQTLPPAMQGATTPENVYNALLGAYFGFKAKPWMHEQAFRSQQKEWGNQGASEVQWEMYKQTPYYKRMGKEQKAAEKETFDTHFSNINPAEALNRLIYSSENQEAPQARKATVIGSANKYANESVEVVREMPVMAQIRVPNEPGLKTIKKEFLRYDQEVVEKDPKDFSLTDFKKKIEDVEIEPGNDSVEIPIARPVENFIKKVFNKDTITNDEYNRNVKGLNKIIFNEIQKAKEAEPDVPAWPKVREQIFKSFKDKNITEEDVGQLRQYYRTETESIQVPRYSLRDNQLIEETEFDFNNNRVSNLSSMKMIHKVAMETGVVENMSDAYFTVKNVVRTNSFTGRREQKRISTLKPSEKDPILNDLVKLADAKGYYPYSGISDKIQMVFMKKNLGDFPSELSRIKKDFLALDKNFNKDYKVLKEQAIKKGGLTEKQYDEMFVSNVRWWESFNGNINVKEIAKGEGYLKDVLNFNKRQQPLFSSYYPLTADTFNSTFKYAVINDIANTSDPAMLKLYNMTKDLKTGNNVNGFAEWSDGQIPMVQRKFDAITMDTGLNSQSGFVKPFIVVRDPKNGLMINKLAISRASDKLDAALTEAGLDTYIPLTVAKQYGSRNVLDINYKEFTDGQLPKIGFTQKGKPISEQKIKDSIYEMNPSDIVVDWNTRDTSYRKIEKNEYVKVFKQIQEQFMNHDVFEKMSKLKNDDGTRLDINKSMNEFMQSKFEGNAKSNTKLETYINGQIKNKEILKQLDKEFNKLGLDQIVEAMKDKSPAGESFRELARRKFVRLRSEEMSEETANLKHDWNATFEREKLTNTEQILENAGTTDSVVLGKRVADYMDRAMTNYLLNRMLQPEVFGGKGIMLNYTPDLVMRKDPYGNTSRLLKEENVFFLQNNFEQMKMPYAITGTGQKITKIKGKPVTLKDQWEMYLAEASQTKAKMLMLENMSSIVTRSPIDGISGVMQMEFGGFTGQQGGGILLHPKAMKRAGGADLDIDSANFYMNSLPKEFQKISREFKNDFNEVMDYVDKTYGSLNDLMLKKFIDTRNEPVGKKTFLGMFDPYLRFQTANTIQQASDIARGVAVNAKRDIRILYNAARRDPKGFFKHIDDRGNAIHFYPRKSEMDLKATSMAGVQVTVDVAKFGKLHNIQRIKAEIMHSAFEKIMVFPKKGKAYQIGWNPNAKKPNLMLQEFFSYQSKLPGRVSFTDSPIASFSNTLQKMYGKDRSTGLPWLRNDVLDAAKQHPKWDIGPYAKMANLVQKLDYTDSMFQRYQVDIPGYTRYMQNITQAIRNRPELLRFVSDKDFPMRYAIDIGKRMEQLNRYYTPDRTSSMYNHAFNLATTKGLKQFVNNKSVFEEWVDSHVVKRGKKGTVNLLRESKTFKNTMKDDSPESREMFVRRYLKEINDFIDNDIEVFTSLKTINDIGTKHNIKPDADLPRFDPQKEGPQLTSLNKLFMDTATDIKSEFKELYNRSRNDKRLSPNQTALSAIYERLNGDAPNSVKNRITQAVEYLNNNRRENVEPITETGLRELFDAYLIGSLNKDKVTRSFYFTPQLVSPNVITQFNQNKQLMFTSSFKKMTVPQIEKMFVEAPNAKALKEEAALNSRSLDFEFFKPTKEVKDFDPQTRTLYNKIDKQLASLRKTAKLTKEEEVKFLKWFALERGKGSTKDFDKYDLRGLNLYLDEVVNGSGLFRKIFRSERMAKSGSFLSDIDEKGNLKPSLWSWVKLADSVAFDNQKNDMNFMDRQARTGYAYKTVIQKDPVTGEKIAVREYGKYKKWVPQSHFSKLQETFYGSEQYNSGMKRRHEEETQDIYGSRIIEGASSKKDKANDLLEIAIYEREAWGTIKRKEDKFTYMQDGVKRNEAEQKLMIKRLKKDAIPKYIELTKEKYRYTIDGKTGNYTAREIIDSLKAKMETDFSDFSKNHIQLPNNYTEQLQKVISDKKLSKKVVMPEGTIDVTEIPITYLQDSLVTPLTKPDALVKKGTKHLTYSQVRHMGREADIKDASLDMTVENTPFLKKAWNRKLKDVYKFEQIKNSMKDDNNKNISLFDNLRKGVAVKQELMNTYYNSILRFMHLDKTETTAWRENLKQTWAERDPKGPLTKKELEVRKAFKAYEKYIKEQDTYEFSGDRNVEMLVAQVRNYFSKKNIFENAEGMMERGYVPHKETTDVYSQFLHDIALAKRKISIPLYTRQYFRHSKLNGFQPVGIREQYVPHLNFDPTVLRKEIIKEAESINKKVPTLQERNKLIDNLFKRFEDTVTNQSKEDGGMADYTKDSLLLKKYEGDRGVQHLTAMGSDSVPGNMLSRQLNLDGYARDFSIIGQYKSAVQSAIGTEMSAMMAKRYIREFVKKQPMGKNTKDWEDYMRIFARDMTGAPSTVTQEMLNSKTLNIKRTPWWYTSDQYLYSKKSIHKLVDKLSGRAKPSAFVKRLFEERQKGRVDGQLDLFDPNTRQTFDQWWQSQRQAHAIKFDKDGNPVERNMNWFAGQMKNFSQLEGKYQLATLLARLKVVVNNVFGGGTNTWVYTGAKPLRDARNIEIWQSINPKFKKMEDVDNWVGELGVIEEMVKYDLGYVGMKRKPEYDKFAEELSKLASKKWKEKGADSIYEPTFNELVKKYNVTGKAMDIAASFMGRSELYLRTNTFKAAYLGMRENFSPVEFGLNDPYLVEQAKKAVKASQFLYTAPFRPSFARTSAGKVYSRFKLWAWNSVKFRKDVYREAKFAGFRPGSAEAKRLERMMTADLFMIGMAKLLPYTMFDYSLPAPYSYFQDMSDWAFGSDQQRERAYYGALPTAIAPLHEFMPSILRGPEAVFGNIFSGNWERFANYTLVSHFPFGLLGRDIYNAVQSPAMLGEFVTGLPLHRMNRLKEDIIEGKKAPAYTPGFF